MRKPVTYVNIALLLAAVWLTTGMRAEWRRKSVRYAQFAAVLPALGPSSTPVAVPAGVAPAVSSYAEVVDRNLFVQDRNNSQPVVAKKPAPPLPVAIGTMNLGSGMIALMSEAAQQSFRRTKEGDEIGGYKVVEIQAHKVVVEFDGQRSSIDVYESAAAIAPPPQANTAATSPVSQVTNASQPAASAAAAPAPSVPVVSDLPQRPAGALPADPADPYKTCVVEGNRIKCQRKTPFGTQTWYQPLKP